MNLELMMCKIVILCILSGALFVEADSYKLKKSANEVLNQTRQYFNELIISLDVAINKTKIHEFDDSEIITQNNMYEVNYKESMSSIYMYIPSENMLRVSAMLDDARNNIKSIELNFNGSDKHAVTECLESELFVIETAYDVLYTRIERCVQFKYQVYDESLKTIDYNRDEIVIKINETERKCLHSKTEEIHANCLRKMLPTIKMMAKEIENFVEMTLENKKKFSEPNEDCSTINFDSFNATLITAQRNAHFCVHRLKDTNDIYN